MKFVIKQATPKDANKVVELAFKLMAHEGNLDARDKIRRPAALKKSIIEKMSTAKDRVWFLAWVDNKAVGVARAQVMETKIGPERGAFTFLYVEPKYRRHGIARALTEARIKWLRGQGIKYAQVDIMPGNEASLANLKKYNPKPWYQLYTIKFK